MTLEQFYSAWADLYEANQTKDSNERKTIMRTWCLDKMKNPEDLSDGVFEKISAWYKLLSNQ